MLENPITSTAVGLAWSKLRNLVVNAKQRFQEFFVLSYGGKE